MDNLMTTDERAANALKRAVSRDLSGATRAVRTPDYAQAASTATAHSRTIALARRRRIPRILFTACASILIAFGAFQSGKSLFSSSAPQQSAYYSELLLLVDEIHIANPARFELAALTEFE